MSEIEVRFASGHECRGGTRADFCEECNKPIEVRVTSETGGQKGQKDARLGGADPKALMELALVYGMGEKKYARYNYLKGYPWSLSIDALFRHLLAFLAGEDRDPESGLLHTAHVAWHALALTSFTQRQIGTDDRAPQAPQSAKEKPTYDWCSHPEEARYAVVAGVSRCTKCYALLAKSTSSPWGDV